MRIYYYQRRDQIANYGDELNTWLWQRLLPDLVDQGNDAILVGLGTLLNNRLPQRIGQARKVIIFSTGAGYEAPLEDFPTHWQIFCVRGPLTAQQLNLSPALAITDGGILLRRLVKTVNAPAQVTAFIPHVHHATFAGDAWKMICQAIGYRYIDPRWPVAEVIAAIQNSQLLLAEAMHGAITADALGIPWVPIITSPRILSFKWQDWCASIQQPYMPVSLPPLSPGYPRYGQGFRSGWRAVKHWTTVVAQGNGLPMAQQLEQVAAALEKVPRRSRPILSDRAHLENLTQALESKLEELRHDLLRLT